MTYTAGNLIEATDYNNFVGNTNSKTANQINTIWGVGNADAGYGQSTTVSTVAVNDQVTATQWSTMLSRMESIRAHQGSSLSSWPATTPTTGNTIAIISNLSNNITTLYNNRLTASAVDTKVSSFSGNTVSRTAVWGGNLATQTINHVFNVTFTSGDAARYFFNAGGRIEIDPSMASGTDNAKERSWTALINSFGQYRLSAQTSELVNELTSNVVTETYTSQDAAVSTVGYHDLTTTDQQTVSKGLIPTPYGNASGGLNRIVVNVKSNGSQGSNGDKGTIITITVSYIDGHVDAASGAAETADRVTATLTSAISYDPPQTTQLSNVWGTPTFSTTGSTTA